MVKRAGALPGDTFKVVDDHPIINGWPVPNCRVGEVTLGSGVTGWAPAQGTIFVEYLHEHAYLTFHEARFQQGEQGPYRVQEGEAWVLGDSRNNSSDFHAWYDGKGGRVPLDDIKGRAWVVWLSFTGQGRVDWGRFWLKIHGAPVLPPGVPPARQRQLTDCLQKRPSPADATATRRAGRIDGWGSAPPPVRPRRRLPGRSAASTRAPNHRASPRVT